MKKWSWNVWKCVGVCLVCFLSKIMDSLLTLWHIIKQTEYLWCRICYQVSLKYEIQHTEFMISYLWSFQKLKFVRRLYSVAATMAKYNLVLWNHWCFLFVYGVMVIQHSLELCLSICWLDWQLLCRELMRLI